MERFSEDVDVLVLPAGRGRGATDKLMKQLSTTAAVHVNGEARSVGGAESGRHRSFEISYPTTRPPTDLIATSVLLEMGIRGGNHPHDVNKLLEAVDRLADRVEFDAVVADITEVSARWFSGTGTPEGRPPDGFASCRAFHPDDEVSRRLSRSYEATMDELHFGTDPIPSWDQICDRVQQTGGLLSPVTLVRSRGFKSPTGLASTHPNALTCGNTQHFVSEGGLVP